MDGTTLRTARQARGITIAHVAIALGKSVPYISDIERNRREWRRWPRERIELLAVVLDLDIARTIQAAAEFRLEGLLRPDEFTVVLEFKRKEV